MKFKTYKERELKRLISHKPIGESCNVFRVDNGVEKINKDLLFDLRRFYHIMMPISLVDEEQIKWLHEKQENISSSRLPSGIMEFEHKPIGVIYPQYFENYKTFNEMYKEDTDLFFENFKQAISKNIELMNNGIYNYDFTMGNILYKNHDVQLIDLDGKYISKRQDYHKVYSYFMMGLLTQIFKKIETEYDEYNQKLAFAELRAILCSIPNQETKIDYPYQVLEEVEDAQILKR